MPSRPGEELTSMTNGPRLARRISTPQTSSPMILAARTAVARSRGDKRTAVAVPPQCKLERNSPSRPCRFMAATTLSPITKQRISLALAS